MQNKQNGYINTRTSDYNCIRITQPSGITNYAEQDTLHQSALHPHTVRLLTEGDDTRGCGDTIGPPDDAQRAARNMLRSVM